MLTHKGILFFFLIASFLMERGAYGQSLAEGVFELRGKTQGTTYTIKYKDPANRNLQGQIDSILTGFSRSLSTYLPDSEISQFNSGTSHRFSSPYFYPVLIQAKEIYLQTGGAFNPCVYPLVEAYGFGPKSQPIGNTSLDSLLPLTNFDLLVFDSLSVTKKRKGVRLDFNGIAQGYSVDVVAQYLEEQNIKDFMVEIGGEVYCKGLNFQGGNWTIGIDNPLDGEERTRPYATVRLHNRALATSGNYRNFRISNGKRYSHLIDPATGAPAENELISVSVFAKDCMTADAYATAFMVMGKEKALRFLENFKELDVLLIYVDQEGEIRNVVTEGMREVLKLRI